MIRTRLAFCALAALAAGCEPVHDNEEIGPKMLTRIARQTGLRPEDL